MRQYFAAAAALALISCGGGGDGNEAAGDKAAEGAGTSGASASLQPGQWEITTQVLSMSAPNMPQGVNIPLPGPTTIRTCITPEQAGQPGANIFTGSGESGGCTYESNNVRGGRVEATVECNTADGTMRSTMTGQYGGSSFEVNQQVETTASGQTMEMESRTSGRRVGDCPG